MKSSLSYFRFLLALFLFLSPLAIASAQESTEQEYEALLRFRNMFHSIGMKKGLREENLQQMIYLPPKALLEVPADAAAADSAEDVLAALTINVRRFAPTDLYRNGVDTQVDDIDTDEIFHQKGPATFIVIPGIFSEFINDGVFDEVYTGPSSFKDRWHEQLAAVTDEAYDLKTLGKIRGPLTDRVRLGSIDDANHRSKVQVIFLKAKWGSFESVGKLEDAAAINLDRINKVFSAISLSDCPNIYLVGYSRGAPVALEMLTKAYQNPARYPFLQNLKGVVNLAGVIYGSDIADKLFDKDAPMRKSLSKLQSLLGGMIATKDGFWYLNHWFKSGPAIIKILAETLQQQALQPMPEGMRLEKLRADFSDPFFMISLIRGCFDNFFKFSFSNRDYLNNLERAKILVDKLLEASLELTTPARVAWWQSHTLPENLKIYSIAGSMPEVTTRERSSVLLNNPNYGANTLDYVRVLRRGVYDIYASTGVSLNDSQIIEPKIRPWPGLLQKFNPEQGPLKTYYMGVLGTHHWGMSFASALKQVNGQGNTFARTLLLEAMGAFALSPEE